MMMYLPQMTELFFYRIASGVYRVICDGLMVDAPHGMVDEAIKVLVGDQWDDEK
jgi:hypothetical protein